MDASPNINIGMEDIPSCASNVESIMLQLAIYLFMEYISNTSRVFGETPGTHTLRVNRFVEERVAICVV